MGTTVRRQYFDEWAATGRKPQKLASLPKLSRLTAHLWNHFKTLHKQRRYQDGQPLDITWAEFHYWRTENRIKLDAWEREAIFKVDAAVLVLLRQQSERARKRAARGRQ